MHMFQLWLMLHLGERRMRRPPTPPDPALPIDPTWLAWCETVVPMARGAFVVARTAQDEIALSLPAFDGMIRFWFLPTTHPRTHAQACRIQVAIGDTLPMLWVALDDPHATSKIETFILDHSERYVEIAERGHHILETMRDPTIIHCE